MLVLDLFSGVGMFARGLQRAGFTTAAFCEIEPFCRQVLAERYPGTPIYDDVRSVTAQRLRDDGVTADAICGGFPCQDLSIAGKAAGIDGNRSGLWSEIVRLAGEMGRPVLMLENVANLLAGPSERPGQWFGRVLGDLAALRYDVWWDCIPASALGAPHERDRVWIVAHPERDGVQGWQVAAAVEPELRRAQQLPGFLQSSFGDAVSAARVWRADHGVASRLDVARNRAVGNGLNFRIPELIGRALLTLPERSAA